MVNASFAGQLCQIINAHPEKWFAYQYGDLQKHNQYAYDQNCLTGMPFSHSAAPLRKSTMYHVWGECEERLKRTCLHRFRTLTDVFHWVFTMWDIMNNDFEPVGLDHYGRAFVVDHIEPVLDAIANGNDRVICINDSYQITYEEYEQYKRLLMEVMEKKYPNRSQYEK